MDIITDLSSRAVSWMYLIHDILEEADTLNQDNWQLLPSHALANTMRNVVSEQKRDGLSEKIRDLVWISDTIVENQVGAVFFDIAEGLIKWLQKEELLELLNSAHPKPFNWRTSINRKLYNDTERIYTLAAALKYIPIQVILALGGGSCNASRQRCYQISYFSESVISGDLFHLCENWWNESFDGKPRKEWVPKMLTDIYSLKRFLKGDFNEIYKATKGETNKEALNKAKTKSGKKHCQPLPFETIFPEELDEIERSREHRLSQKKSSHPRCPENTVANGPIYRATNMQLWGLALSGGGIRSATFNLGILQALAGKGHLEKFDYLSTVSGGGYIGTWLAAWIKREGSMKNVCHRLNPNDSKDPFAEEVRPIRWLRMFSNYLTPTTGIMSPDSWTMGITWVRNTLLNLTILLLALISTFAFIQHIYDFWIRTTTTYTNPKEIALIWSLVFMSVGAILAGIGMRSFHPSSTRLFPYFRLPDSRFFAVCLMAWCIIGAFILSGWLFFLAKEQCSVRELFNIMWIPATLSLLFMTFVAIVGKYHKGLFQFISLGSQFIIFLFTAVASFFGLLLLLASVKIIEYMRYGFLYDEGLKYNDRFIFTFALPLVLEVICIVVVLRMALLGKIFPDGRREWWGRAGAYIHRFMLFWIIACSATLLIKFDWIKNWMALVPALSWSAFVGFAVKTAFNNKTPELKGGLLSYKDTFIRAAPYVFGIGFVFLGAHLHNQWSGMRTEIQEHFEKQPQTWVKQPEVLAFSGTLFLVGITLLFSWRIGINEFSLHHFYKNRLIRAYLGASRRRVDRDKTANIFTGFDKRDDHCLSEFTTAKGYYGPYLLINATMNCSIVSELDRQDRKAESFLFSALYCGFDCSRTRSAASSRTKTYDYAYRPTAWYAYRNGPKIGTAMAISGAAVNPNMGYHSASATAFLLTIFNVRLGWWLGNTRRSTWTRSDPRLGLVQLLSDLMGKSHTRSKYISLSDGGHFDNMGLYELIRRKCSNILLCDAEEDAKFTCDGLANAIRRCRIDFGVDIIIDVSKIVEKNENGFSAMHVAYGTIQYPEDPVGKPSGKLTYIKSSVCGKESVDVREYYLDNPLFPHQSTADQFFNESQFESYRKLGFDIVSNKEFQLWETRKI